MLNNALEIVWLIFLLFGSFVVYGLFIKLNTYLDSARLMVSELERHHTKTRCKLDVLNYEFEKIKINNDLLQTPSDQFDRIKRSAG